GVEIRSSIIASQIEEHRLYGGVVPEIASRRHIENIVGVTERALADADVALGDIDAIAATCEPGLIGALLAGLSFAKGLSYAAQKPLVAVNHLHGHIASLWLTHPQLETPFIAFVVSGGHSSLVRADSRTSFTTLGEAMDDAAGEAFDKVARCLGLPYPGGPELSRLALDGDYRAYKLPDPHSDRRFDVSFSGLKTAVINIVNTAAMKNEPLERASLAAAFEHRAIEMLATRLVSAASEANLPACICGGVSANSALKSRAGELCANAGIPFFSPDMKLCGDNAAMIASAGYFDFIAGSRAPLCQNAFANARV
ncbi:MAG: tRNA (adenosine(37)-N6)-threonylcarbamoyltransferase complex transferase subunit TsaD, partial [Oscillospiraceae bacterium]